MTIHYVKKYMFPNPDLKRQFHAARRDIDHWFLDPIQNAEVKRDVMGFEPLWIVILGSFQCIYFALDLCIILHIYRKLAFSSRHNEEKVGYFYLQVFSGFYTLVKRDSTLSRSWVKGGTTFQSFSVLTISSSFKCNAVAVLRDSSFFVGKPSNLASTYKYIAL